jgi:hypothetical protein
MASISQFKTAIQGGGARTNQFRCELTFPAFVSLGSLAGQASQFLVEATQLPGISVGDIQVPYRGRIVHVAGDIEFTGWDVTIINDTDFVIRKAFEQWMNGINNHTTTAGLTSASQYQTDISVNQLDKNDAVLKTYKMTDAYPIQLAPIQLSFGDNNQIERFQVSFQFNTWTSDTTS